MLTVSNICKAYGGQELFDEASLQLSPGERLGLAGRNGHGKSTLFRLILGEEEIDSGIISVLKGYRIGHLAQHLHFTQPTILEEACLGLIPEEEYDHYKAEAILFGLGFSKEDMERPPSEFSGGFQIRLNLAKLLVSNPNLLLLDEPTNYLDIVSIRWITRFLRQWKNELIIISHDREFMDSVVTHTAIIHRKKIRKVPGGTAKLYELIAQEEETYEKTRLNEAKKREQTEAFISRFKAQASKAAIVQSRIKMLDKLPKLDKLDTIDELAFSFHTAPFNANTMMDVKNLTFGFDPEHPFIEKISVAIHPEDRIAIIGKNGKGKSTLLNLLAGELTPQSGEIKSHANTKLGYFGQTNIARLHPTLSVEEEISQANPLLNRTSVKGICGQMMFTQDLSEKKIAHLSGGEKSRVLLGKILATPANLLFLDEPTNHLDMQSIEALIDSIQRFDGACLIVTHSEEILRTIATKLVVFHRGGVEVFNGNYDEFLEKIGWEDEEDSATKKKKPNNKQELRKQRSGVITDRSRVLTPLKNEMTKLENTICRMEADIITINQDLVKASEQQDVQATIDLSIRAQKCQDAMDAAFERLQEVTAEHDEIAAEFQALIPE